MKLKANKGDPFDALGNRYRREIVELLAHKPRSVQEIADRLPISRPAVSRHLRVLNKACLVSDEQLGTRRVYRLAEQRPGAAGAAPADLSSDKSLPVELFAQNTRPR